MRFSILYCALHRQSPANLDSAKKPAILRRRVPSGTCTGVRQNFSHGQQAGATGEEAAEGRKCEGGAGNGSGRESVHDTNLRSVGEQNRCQVGPTILLRAPRPDPPLRPMQKEAELNAVNHGIVVTLGITPRNY